MTDGVTVISLLVSNTTAVTYHVCQIALNQKLSHEFESGVNFRVVLM